MLNLPVRPESQSVPMHESEALIAGSVGFIGVTTGVVFVYSTVTFARKVAAGMLGSAASDEMVNDAFGEITNMIVGNIKSRLDDRGISCALTIPSIVRGNNFTIEPVSSSLRRISKFQCGDNHVVVEVLLKSNSAQTALAA